jgi:hypothetical protein
MLRLLMLMLMLMDRSQVLAAQPEGPPSGVEVVVVAAAAGDPQRLPRRRGHSVPRDARADRTYREWPYVRESGSWVLVAGDDERRRA